MKSPPVTPPLPFPLAPLEPDTVGALGRSADVLLLLVYGGIVFFFLFRFLQHRKLPSLGIALLPMGWIVISAHQLGILDERASNAGCWVGLVFGVFLAASLFDIERRRPG